MVMTGFTTKRNGFHFANDFVNPILDLPMVGKIQTRGRCGGMAFAALDYYFAGLPVPAATKADFGSAGVPADGTPLADYLWTRLIESFVLNGTTFVEWTLALDHPTWLRGKGVQRMTLEDELPKVRRSIDAKRPVALGLVGASTLADVGNRNHQIVCCGYDVAPDGATVLHVYDNNHPDLDVDLRLGPRRGRVVESTGESWRGLFVEVYTTKRPTYVTTVPVVPRRAIVEPAVSLLAPPHRVG